jgi:5S rRNA maturation endonuclease (ribonuclease M5)
MQVVGPEVVAEAIRRALSCGRRGCACARPGPTGPAHCPCHDDEHPSLGIYVRDGRVFVKCFTGCEREHIIEELRARGLWPEKGAKRKAKGSREAREDSTKTIVASYNYVDEEGNLLFQVVRYEPKSFKARRPDGRGGWIYSLDGVRLVPYRLPEVLRAVREGHEIWICEGEKDADALCAAGVVATTNPFGAKKWRPEFSEILRGARVVVVRDKDKAGHEHADLVVASLLGIAASIRLVEAREGKDAADHLAVGWGIGDFVEVPLPKPSNGADLLRDLEAYVRRYVVLPEGAALPIAVWVLHTYMVDEFLITPYLVITSPEKRCGKSLLLDLLHEIVCKPLGTANISEAALFRVVDSEHPTLLLDEAQILRDRSDRSAALHDLLAAGHRRGQRAVRMVGQGAALNPREFDVFCAKAIALIGRPTDVILDRGIEIRMQRRAPHERVERFRLRRVQAEAEELRSKIEEWVVANRRAVALEYEQIEPPAFLNDRAADNWAPLFAIIQVADPSRLSELERCAAILSGGGVPEDVESLGIRLLADIRRVFEERGVDRLPTSQLIEALAELEESPWGNLHGHGRAITPHDLARRLRPYGVHPRKWREGERTIRGYTFEDFKDVFMRYLSSDTSKAPQVTQPSDDGPSRHFDEPPQRGSVADSENGSNPHGYGLVSLVAFSGRVKGDKCISRDEGGGPEGNHREMSSMLDTRDPLVRRALELFDGRVVEVRPHPTFPGDDGRRVAAWRVGKELQFPEVLTRDGLMTVVPAGPQAWLRYLSTCTNTTVDGFLKRLREITGGG